MWGSQTAFHWGHSCCGATPADGQEQKTNLFGLHTWSLRSVAGYSVIPGCWILRRLWDISRERPFLLINLQSESLQCLKMEIEAQKVKGSRRYSECVAVSLWSRHALAPLQAPGLQGGTLSGSIRQGPASACSLLSPRTGLNMGMSSQSVSIRNSLARRAVGFRVRLTASIPTPNPQFPGLLPWTSHQTSQWRCAQLESRAKSYTYLVRNWWGL